MPATFHTVYQPYLVHVQFNLCNVLNLLLDLLHEKKQN